MGRPLHKLPVTRVTKKKGTVVKVKTKRLSNGTLLRINIVKGKKRKARASGTAK